MHDILVIVASVGGSLVTMGVGWLGIRYFRKAGGDEAQGKLNIIYKELAEAFEDRVAQIESRERDTNASFETCKRRLLEVEQMLLNVRRERTELRMEIDDLHAIVRELREGGAPSGAA